MTSIKGYEKYKIYEDGKIISRFGKELYHNIKKDKYINIVLYKNNKCKTFRLHRLLAIAFIPNPENKPDVDHIDRNRSNNNLENLQWVTKLENNQNKGDMKNNTSGNKNIHF